MMQNHEKYQKEWKTTVRQSKAMEDYGNPPKINALSMVIIIYAIEITK